MNSSHSEESGKVLRLRGKKRVRVLTAAEKRDHVLLKAKWDHEAKTRKISLTELASFFGLHQSAPAPYLRGDAPLTTEWKMRFALYLDYKPQEIWPEWEYRALTEGDIPPSMHILSVVWKALSRAARADVLGYIRDKFEKFLPKDIDFTSLVK